MPPTPCCRNYRRLHSCRLRPCLEWCQATLLIRTPELAYSFVLLKLELGSICCISTVIFADGAYGGLTVCGRIRARWARKPLYIANSPSVRTVLYKQSNTPLYKFPVWLYIRDMIVSALAVSYRLPHEASVFIPGGCITQQTTKPLAVLLAR